VQLARRFDQFLLPWGKWNLCPAWPPTIIHTDIVRPRTVPDEKQLEDRTFGVVIDTSGSMDRYMLAVALGSVASYSDSRDVPFARVVILFCKKQ
jgi:hypothetical protein